MMQQLWKSFPRQFEQRINSLLDQAEPNAVKAFQLYKACRQENLFSDSFESFSEKINLYYSKSRRDRTKSDIDRFLDRPMEQHLHADFHLTFRSAEMNPSEIRDIASWAHHVLRVGGHIDTSASSIRILNEVIISVTSPSFFEKDIDIEFSDICDRWQKIITEKIGSTQTPEIKGLFSKLATLDKQSQGLATDLPVDDPPMAVQTGFYDFTQTELTWISAVYNLATSSQKLPKYPLSKGPQKLQLIELERIVTLYAIIQLTDKAELLQHKENIRATVLDRCRFLLRLG